MINQTVNVQACNPYQEVNALSLTHLEWIIDSLNPQAQPVVSREFTLNPEIPGFAAELQEMGFRLVYDGLSQAYLHDTKRMIVDSGKFNNIYLSGRIQNEVVALYEMLKAKYSDETVLVNRLMLLVDINGSYKTVELSSPAEPLMAGNYMPPVIEKFEYLARQMVADKPKGRIGILSGYPGTGKTFLIRALLDRYAKDTQFILINTDQCVSLGSRLHSFMQMLASSVEEEKTVLIMEDADSAIAPRSAQNLSAIQSILNFGDGLMGEALDIRLLITTNTRTVDIDPAILRPGRLIQHIDVPSLEVSFANALYKRLTGQEGTYKKPVTVAHVYQDMGVTEKYSAAAE